MLQLRRTENSPGIPKTHPQNGVATSSPEDQEESKLEEEFKSGSPLPRKEKVLEVRGSSEDASSFLSFRNFPSFYPPCPLL